MLSHFQPAAPEMALSRAFEIASEILEAERAVPVKPTPDPSAAMSQLALGIPTRGLGQDGALAALRRVMLATPTSAGTGFFNQLFGGREPVALAAEMLKAVVNTSMYTYKAAGVQVLVERVLLEKMGAMSGMSGGDGLFTPGGSMSNMAAMIVARNEMVEGARERGVGSGPYGVYVSEEAHYSIRKNAGLIGLGRDSVRAVEADALGRMIPEELDAAIEADLRAGVRPLMIVATAGTTVMGAFDPIEPLAYIAERRRLWLHVDGAFGGTALLSRSHRHLLDGLSRADSFTWDAHKMMGVPLVSSVCLFRRPGLSARHFDESASYLYQSAGDDLNPGRRSIQCGRPNEAIKLWALWQALGDEGYETRTDRQFALARHAVERVRSDRDFILAFDPQWVNVCFELRGVSSEAICDRLDREQSAKVGYGIVKGRPVIRLVLVNPHLSEDDIDRVFDEIKRVGRSIG